MVLLSLLCFSLDEKGCPIGLPVSSFKIFSFSPPESQVLIPHKGLEAWNLKDPVLGWGLGHFLIKLSIPYTYKPQNLIFSPNDRSFRTKHGKCPLPQCKISPRKNIPWKRPVTLESLSRQACQLLPFAPFFTSPILSKFPKHSEDKNYLMSRQLGRTKNLFIINKNYF